MKNNSFVNPAFCQQSEFYSSPSGGPQSTQFMRKASSSFKVNRSDSINSIGVNYQKRNYNKSLLSLNSSLSAAGPPRTVPKPSDVCSGVNNNNNNNSGRYAIVPLEDLPRDIDRSYKIVSNNFVKSQNNLDCFSSLPPNINDYNTSDDLDKNYSSLAYESEINNEKTPPPRLYNAFSSDFGATSFVIMDKKKVQRYDVIPTDDDEEIVDDNQEIIQMHNGRAHRYAIIHAEEEEEEEDQENDTDGDNNEENVEATHTKPQQIQSKNHNYATIRETSQHKMMQQSTPKKKIYSTNKSQIRQSFITPTKNIATQKLHELLSTPNKSQHSVINQSSPIKYYSTPNRSQLQPAPPMSAIPTSQLVHQQPPQPPPPPSLASSKQYEFYPQKLNYDHYPVKHMNNGGGIMYKGGGSTTTKANAINDRRTTAVITPRLLISQSNGVLNMSHHNEYDDDIVHEGLKQLEHLEELPQKMSNAFLTVSIISAILFICGTLNTGLVVYLIYNYGKSLFMDVALTSAIAAIFLGIQGFKSRKHVQLPNRNYISGYLVVNIFSLLKCCALLVLLVLEPFPGSPLHDVTSGIILGLSTLTLLLISLGIVISKWCTLTPPDNRVDMYT